MPSNSGKKIGMMQLGLLTVAALLMSGALIVKTKRDANAEVPVVVAQDVAAEVPAAGDDNMPKRTFGNSAIPQATLEGEPGVSEGSEGNEGSGISVEEAERMAPPVMAEPNCSAYEGWVGKPVDRAAVEATGKPHRIFEARRCDDDGFQSGTHQRGDG